MRVLGIDIGGTGIKGAVVDTKHGVLKTDRLRLLTPHPAEPRAVADVVQTLVGHFDWSGPIGCTFPGVTKGGTIHTAANLVDGWVGVDAAVLFGEATGCPVTVLNDADAAGLAEVAFGAARGHEGLVMMITLGTGIGTAIVHDGVLVPNTELGHIALHGDDAEKYASEIVREREDLGYDVWGTRVDEYLRLLEDLFWPDLFVLGGGISKKADKFVEYLHCRTPVVAARLLNQAGIVGAAFEASRAGDRSKNKHGKSKHHDKKK
jgi:polyphosphate glucokinase